MFPLPRRVAEGASDSTAVEPPHVDAQAMRIAVVLDSARPRVVTTRAVYACGAGPRTCRIAGVDAVVGFQAVTLTGDRARASIVLLRSTGLPRVPVQRVIQDVEFARTAGRWRFVRVVVTSST